MTGAREHGGGVRQEEDRIRTGSVVAVGVGALLVFLLASLVTLSWLRVKEGDRPPLPLPPDLGRSKIGMVEQQLFDLPSRGEQDRSARRRRLEEYGWVDRDAGVVHVPIERAMRLVAAGVRAPASAPAPAKVPGGPP